MQTVSESLRPPHPAPLAGVMLAALAVAALNVHDVAAQSSYTTPYTFTTFAGNPGFGSADGTGSDARFAKPLRVAVDAGGNIYVADSCNYTIRKMTPEGVVTTIAGLAGCPGSDDGLGRQARFGGAPCGLAFDAAGKLYVADGGNHTIRKLTVQGTNWAVTTVAGLAGFPGIANGNGTAARFTKPAAVAVDAVGNLYIADFGNHTIRKMTPQGAVTTLAGLAGTAGTNDGFGSAARFNMPCDVALGSDGALYLADQGNHAIRRITLAGDVTTLAGLAGSYGSPDGMGTGARFSAPYGLGADTNGNLYVADRNNHTIRKVTLEGVVTTPAGLAGTAGTNDGFGGSALFNRPCSVALDGTGNIYVADTFNNTIRKLIAAGDFFEVTTLAGLAVGTAGSADGTGPDARFYLPWGMAIDAQGYIYVADWGNNTVRKITPGRDVTTVVPPGTFNGPTDVAVDSGGNIYVANRVDQTIMMISPDGLVSIAAGSSGVSGTRDGPAADARLYYPMGVAVDAATNVYIADSLNHTIRKLAPDGVVSTLAGYPRSPGSVDGLGAAARFNNPCFLTVDSAGNVYVADNGNCTIRKVTAGGQVTTIAGLAGNPGNADGIGASARFKGPWGITMDKTGKLYVVEDNRLLRILTLVDGQWRVTTAAGRYQFLGAMDGTGEFVEFMAPTGVAVDDFGSVYVADNGGHTIRKGFPASSVPQPSLQGQGLRAGQFGFDITGFPSVWVFIETSTNLSQWKLDGTFLLENGKNSFVSPDPLAGNRFYRARVR